MNRLLNRFRRGMTLMEVLASIFVICIGLLGVLAVFPFGAFQVAKGRNAEHVANMLAAAGQDVLMTELGKVERWVVPTVVSGTLLTCTVQSNGSTNVYLRNDSDPSTPSDRRFLSNRFYIFDPHDSSATDPFNNNDSNGDVFNCFYKVGAQIDNIDMWKEITTGQDDLIYTLHETKRTDFSGQNNRVASSGRYTWFFTFTPPEGINDSINIRSGLVNTVDLVGGAGATVNVDLLGCYNRTPGDAAAEREVEIDDSAYSKTLDGAQLRLKADSAEKLDLSKTKYIFVLWDLNLSGATNQHRFPYEGCWCKVAYAPKNCDISGNDYYKTIVVTGSLPGSFPNIRRKAIIIDGILYKYSKQISLSLF